MIVHLPFTPATVHSCTHTKNGTVHSCTHTKNGTHIGQNDNCHHHHRNTNGKQVTTRTKPMSEPPHSNTNDSNSSILTTSTFEAIPASTVEVRTCSSSAPVLATAAVTAYHHNHNANDDKKFVMCYHCHHQLRSNALTKYAIASRLISSSMVTGQQRSHGTRFLFLDGAPDIHSCHHK